MNTLFEMWDSVAAFAHWIGTNAGVLIAACALI
jgi:hypothetical protein